MSNFDDLIDYFESDVLELLTRASSLGVEFDDEPETAYRLVACLVLSFIASDHELEQQLDSRWGTSEVEVFKQLMRMVSDENMSFTGVPEIDNAVLAAAFQEISSDLDDFKYEGARLLVVSSLLLSVMEEDDTLFDVSRNTLDFIADVVTLNGLTEYEVQDFAAIIGLFAYGWTTLNVVQKMNQSIEEKIERVSELSNLLPELDREDFLSMARQFSETSKFEFLSDVSNYIWDIFRSSGADDLLNETAKNNDPVFAERSFAKSDTHMSEAQQLVEAHNSSEASDGGSRESLIQLIHQLEELVGLDEVKHEVKRIASRVDVDNKRRQAGLVVAPTSRHLVFIGDPGTGKTSVARILAAIYRECGLLRNGHLVEVGKNDLVAGYLGQTAGKVSATVEKALGGVLFIDEAYSLKTKDDDFFGQEAIDTLVSQMENYRDDLVVIIAGYPAEMDEFIATNPGLKSRFPKTINFPNYEPEELVTIFLQMLEKNGYVADDAAKRSATGFLLKQSKTTGFGNARGVRNFFESILDSQATRLSLVPAPTHQDLIQILEVDISAL